MNLAWIDTETTGLDTAKCERLEIGLVITTSELEVLHAVSYYIIDERRDDPEGMSDPFIIKMHQENGLWVDRDRDPCKLADAEELLIAAIEQYGAKGSPMCGSSVSFDRAVLADSPILEVLHYRNIDGRTLHNLAEHWGYPLAPKPESTHRAIPDCLDAIAALSHYRRVMFVDRSTL